MFFCGENQKIGEPSTLFMVWKAHPWENLHISTNKTKTKLLTKNQRILSQFGF